MSVARDPVDVTPLSRDERFRVLRLRLDLLAADVGRLRRRLQSDHDLWMLDRISGHVQSLDAMLNPSAAELVKWTAPGDDDAVEAALEIVDCRDAELRRLLGLKAAA